MTQIKTFTQKYYKWIVIVFIIIVVAFFLFGSPKGWNRASKYLEKYELIEKVKIKKLEDSITKSKEYHEEYVDSIKNAESVVVPDFERKFKRSEYEKSKLLEKLDSILYAVNSQRRLDSFAEHAKYE